MAHVTADDRKKYATGPNGSFPIFNKATATSALRLRGHAKSKAVRRAIIHKAARYAPEMARKAWEADKAKGLV